MTLIKMTMTPKKDNDFNYSDSNTNDNDSNYSDSKKYSNDSNYSDSNKYSNDSDKNENDSNKKNNIAWSLLTLLVMLVKTSSKYVSGSGWFSLQWGRRITTE